MIYEKLAEEDRRPQQKTGLRRGSKMIYERPRLIPLESCERASGYLGRSTGGGVQIPYACNLGGAVCPCDLGGIVQNTS